jgi:gas vesicle protein
LDYASGSVVQLNDLRNNFERFYDQIFKDATDRMPSLIKEFHEDLVNNKKRGRKSSTKVPVDFKGEMKMLIDETVEVYMNEISERFEAKNLKPLISIYNMINDDKESKLSNLETDKLKEDLNIYSKTICFDKLFIELNMYYIIKESNKLDTFEKILASLKENEVFQIFLIC